VKVIQRAGKYQKSYGAVIFGNKFIADNPDTVRRFVKAHFRAAQFIRQNPKEAAAINSKYVRGSTVETLQKSAQYMVFDPRITQASLDELDSDIAFMRTDAKLQGKVTARDLVNSRFSDDITKASPALTADLK
jgi:sulfonate transport system substrate-binding protein